jgi:hypothetical protein
MILRLLAIAVVAVGLAGCGVTRHSVSIAPVGVVRVPESAMPVRSSTPGRDGLRVDFTSSPDLLFEVGYILDDTRFCGDDITRVTAGIAGPFAGSHPIRHRADRERMAAELTSGSPTPPIYSIYLFVARPAIPPSFPYANRPGEYQMPAEPAYDLRREPRSICLSLSLREGYEFARTTNTITFSAEQVAAALR